MTDFQQIAFDPADARAQLRSLPTVAAVFALYGAEDKDEPYIGRTPNLRSRLERLLIPSPKHPRRLQLASRVRRIEWLATGSEFESFLTQFNLLSTALGAERAVERMHLRAPVFLRYFASNRYPRVAVTTRPGVREAAWAYGPFASRAAAERYMDEALKLFQLRRCSEDLEPHPDHPGCVYSEMKMCLAPCFLGCTDARYSEEASAVQSFLATRGASKLQELSQARDRASEALEFEEAARLHAQVARVEGIRALAPELVRPASELRAILLQTSATPGTVAVFLLESGQLRGPALYSTLGMRIQNEQSGSSSLYAQPMMLLPVPEEAEPAIPSPEAQDAHSAAAEAPESTSAASTAAERRQLRNQLDLRWEEVLAELHPCGSTATATTRQACLALLKRWYYRPEAKRSGEIFFPQDDGTWPTRSILRGIGRIAAKMLEAR